ncbi:MAG TPA: hypothetical protein VLK85_26495 [Ramlibacter sp.]|nr:hypothetical protein [Ramlibacter sp.]
MSGSPFPGTRRQWHQSRRVDLREGAGAASGQLLERLVVDVWEQRGARQAPRRSDIGKTRYQPQVWQQVGTAASDFVVQRCHAADDAETSFLCHLQYEEADHVTEIGVVQELRVRGVAAAFGAVQVDVEVPDVPQQVAAGALRNADAQVAAQSPIDEPQVVLAVAIHRKAAEQEHARTCLQAVERLRELFPERG